jgi:hypothetical protein
MTTQESLWLTASVLALLAVLAVLAEWLRGRRRNLDQVGWVPWTLIQVLSFLGAFIAAALAVKL